MSKLLILLVTITSAAAGVAVEASTKSTSYDNTKLPIFFFHGVTSYPRAGDNIKANMTAEGRTFTELSFCPGKCSVTNLNTQVQSAITQIREIIANDADAYANGYVFIAHSQGGLLARAVIEEMDDHNVKTLISLAGAQNGLFQGPQASDLTALYVFISNFGPLVIPTSVFNFANYTTSDYHGIIQHDFEEMVTKHPELAVYSILQMFRSPVKQHFLDANTFLPFYNNLNDCGSDDNSLTCLSEQERRRSNFLKLEAAHFFGSSGDDIISPWEIEILGKYNDVASSEDIETKFESFTIVDVTDTTEYVADTYGLQTLDRRGGLHLHSVDGVAHECWVANATPYGGTEECLWEPIYSAHVYPVLMAASTL